MSAPDLPTPIVVEEVLRVAASLPLAERATYLDAACEGQATVRSCVERMLELHGIGALLQQGADEIVPPEIEAELARLKPEEGGERIGHYKLLQQIGEGGFGIVWMAEQLEPVRRRVALKIIKLGMDTQEVIARFEQERQALAMSHNHKVNRAVFSRDGRRIATACHDGTARVWDARTGEPLTGPLQQNRELHSIEFSPDGQQLATGSFYSAAYIWDLSGENPAPRTLRHSASVYSIRFSADGQRVVTACRDGAARRGRSTRPRGAMPPLHRRNCGGGT